MAVTISIELNGEAHMIAESDSIQDLVDALSLTNQALAVAVNREVVPRGQWAARQFLDGDRVDMVRAIGGG